MPLDRSDLLLPERELATREIAPPDANFYRTSEAALYLRLSPRTLERLRVTGQGPRFMKAGIGKRARVLYRKDHLDDWLAQFTFQATSEYFRRAR